MPRRRGGRTPDSLTYGRTATRASRRNYWKTIAFLAEGKYLNKNNADCIRDAATQHLLSHEDRDLDGSRRLSAGLLREGDRPHRHDRQGAGRRVPFHWRTDFDFPWAGGWLDNQDGRTYERDIVTIIPGRIAAGRDLGRPLRHGLHGGLLRAHTAAGRAWRRPGPTTTIRRRRR